MVKKRSLIDRSRVLSPVVLNTEGNLDETSGGGIYNISRIIEMTSWDGSAVTITSELTLLTGFFSLTDWATNRALVEFQVAGTEGTDAAAGTTTFRSKIGNSSGALSTLVTHTGNELNAASGRGWLYFGGMIIPADGGCSGWIGRNNELQIFATSGLTQVATVPTVTVNLSEQIGVELTIQSSDAGTTIDNMQGFIKVTFLDPDQTNVLGP